MITRDDWNDALDAWTVEERERLGGPPSAHDVVAYLRGELPPDEAARVRALLVYYPELTPLLIDKPRKPFALRLYGVAATVLVAVLSGVLIEQQHRTVQPTVPSSHHEFNALLARGPAQVYELTAGQQRYLITAVPTQPPSEASYDLEIVRDSHIVWRARNVQPLNDTFIVDIPGRFLTPGTYILAIRANEKLIDHYRFRVTE